MVSQNRPIYTRSSMTVPAYTLTHTHLSPYKPGSPSSIMKDLETSPTYNQDRTWFNKHVICYMKFTNSSTYIKVRIKLLQHQVQM
jgi:hypothetical protein